MTLHFFGERAGRIQQSRAPSLLGRYQCQTNMPGTPILSRHAYLKSLLAGRVIDKPVIEEQKVDALENSKKNIDPGLIAQSSLRERETERLKTIRAELASLDPAEMTKLLGELKDNFIERKMSPAAMRRLEDGNWESALVMGELARFYWKKTRGSEWTAGN